MIKKYYDITTRRLNYLWQIAYAVFKLKAGEELNKVGWLYPKGSKEHKISLLNRDFDDWHHRAFYWRNTLEYRVGKNKPYFTRDWRKQMINLMIEIRELYVMAGSSFWDKAKEVKEATDYLNKYINLYKRMN